jgi:Na+-transporting methylmalonyl-CoA/oxaloacetate decarboxylase gamma subunit
MTIGFAFQGDVIVRYVLAALPFIGILLGIVFANRVEPLVLGMPFVLAWIVLWAVLTSVIMAVIYRLDPSNRPSGDATGNATGQEPS